MPKSDFHQHEPTRFTRRTHYKSSLSFSGIDENRSCDSILFCGVEMHSQVRGICLPFQHDRRFFPVPEYLYIPEVKISLHLFRQGLPDCFLERKRDAQITEQTVSSRQTGKFSLRKYPACKPFPVSFHDLTEVFNVNNVYSCQYLHNRL